MDVSDEELVVRLRERDGDEWRFGSHDVGDCRYAEFYEGEVCPWCEAARRRMERELASEPAQA